MDKLSSDIHNTLYPKSILINNSVVRYAEDDKTVLVDTLNLDLAMIVANNCNADYVKLANYTLWLVDFEETDDAISKESFC